jgi:dihydropyrimidine dehydrogenase (NAD+) subunit PreA
MADLTARIGTLELGTPFVLASGPLSHDGNALLRAHRAGVGAVVTKTISQKAARNPVPHIAKIGLGLLNSEKWSDLPAQAWIEEEIPRAKSGGATVIASLGLNVEEVEAIGAELAEAGADALEVCSYDVSEIVPMVRAAAQRVSIPILAKVSANWPDVANVARACMSAGAAGITAIDSVGPALRLDVARREPLVGGGFGWLSGAAILPIALRVVAEVSLATSGVVVGTGGVETADQCIEMLMAGASAVGLCSRPLTGGLETIGRLAEQLGDRLDDLGYAGVDEVIGAALPSLRRSSLHGGREAGEESFAWDEAACTGCGLCVRICPYEARCAPDAVDRAHCRLCGLCTSCCPTGALSLRRDETAGKRRSG